jgi:hypothetical protein
MEVQMKLLIMILFMFIYLGCKLPTDSNGFGSKKGHDPTIYDMYRTNILVLFEYGEPCTTAFARVGTRDLLSGSGYTADSNGMLKLGAQIRQHKNNPRTKVYYCIVYQDTATTDGWYDNVAWAGDIEMIKESEWSADWPDPFLEIVIPQKHPSEYD